jgi:2-methylcitrate dehydratase PrpD
VRVEAAIHPRRLVHVDRPAPKGGLECKFSLQYCLTRALLERRVVLGHFTDEAADEQPVRQAMQKVAVAPHPEMDWASTEHFGAEVRVELRDGARYSAYQDRAVGRGPDIPLPRPLLEAKFLDCWCQTLPREAGETLMREVDALERIPDTRRLFRHFSAAVP